MEHSVVVQVGADTTELTSSLASATRSVHRFSDDTVRAFGALGSIGTALTASMAVVTAGFGVAIKQTVDFDTAIRKAGAIAGATKEQLDDMKNAAMDLGAKTSKSASEVANAMTELAAKGFDANQVIAAMPGIISAAEASGEDLAMTSDTVASALNIWGMEAHEASKVADVLAMSANMTAAGIGDMQLAFKYAGAPAAALGIEMEELAGAVGIMTNAGLQGENAGTALRASLLALNNPAKAQEKIMKELGFSIKDSSGEAKSLTDIVGDLKKATEGMTAADRTATVAKLVGTEATSGFLALMEAGPDAISKMTKALENSAGASAKTAEEMKAGIGGALEELSGAFETLAINVGYILAPAVIAIAKGIQALVNWFNGLSDATQKYFVYGAALVTILGLIVGPLLLLLALLPAIVSGFAAIAGAVGLTSTAFALLLAKIGLIVGGVLAIVTALVYAYNEVEWFNKAVNAVWDGLVNATKAVGKAISAAFGASLSWIVAKFGELKVLTDETLPKIADFFKQLGGSIKDLSSAGFDLIVGKLIELKNTLKDAFGGDPKALTSVFSMIAPTIIGLLVGGIPGILIASSRFLPAIADGLQMNMPAITASIDKVVNGIVSFLENSFPTFVQTGLDFITNLIQGILSAIPAVVGVLTTVLSTVIETIATLLPIILNAGITILTTLLAGIVQALPMIFDAIIMLITTLVTIITENLPVVLDSGINILMALIDGLVQALPLLLAAALGLILSIVTALVENLPKILAAGIQILLALIDGILTILPVLIETALKLILQIVMTLIENLPKIIAAGVKILVALIEGIIQIIPQLIATAIKLIVQIVTTLAQNLPKILAAGAKILYELVKGILSVVWELVKAGGKLIAELVKGIVDGFGKVYDKGAEIVGEAIDGITSTISDMVSIGEDMVSGIVKGIGNGFGWVKSKISELGGNITSWAASVLKIKSPSRVMRDEIGRWIPAGLAEGITRYSGVVVDAAKSLAEEAVPEVPAVSFGYNTPSMAGAGMMASFNNEPAITTQQFNLERMFDGANITLANGYDTEQFMRDSWRVAQDEKRRRGQR